MLYGELRGSGVRSPYRPVPAQPSKVALTTYGGGQAIYVDGLLTVKGKALNIYDAFQALRVNDWQELQTLQYGDALPEQLADLRPLKGFVNPVSHAIVFNDSDEWGCYWYGELVVSEQNQLSAREVLKALPDLDFKEVQVRRSCLGKNCTWPEQGSNLASL